MTDTKILGIDIGTRWIKVVELTQRREKKNTEYVVTGFVKKQIIQDKPIFDSLRESLNENGIRCSEAIACLQSSATEIKFATLKLKSEKNLTSVVKYELTKEGYADLDEYYIDYNKLSEMPLQSGEKEIKIIAVLAKKSVVDSVLGLMDKADISLAAIDCIPAAIYNCFEFLKQLGTSKDESYAFVNLGHSESIVGIVKASKLSFVRVLQIKGDDILNLIRKRFNIESTEALSKFSVNPDTNADQLKDVISLITEEFGRDIKNTVDFFESQEEVEIKKIFLCGGLSTIFGLTDILRQQLIGKELDIMNPFQGLKIDMDDKKKQDLLDNPAQLSVALGLAARMY